ncbi:MAG: hypothetical protein M3126_06490 [Candidatus Eremiobacteraeota bacterium]|nr:hypothetical protein [Candidatus Eremiobacteraeota bacterium]
MIVTRQRRKPRQWHKVILPLAAIGLLATALTLQPSRNVILNGPLAPVWRVSGAVFETVSKPFHFVALNNQIGARDKTIAQLQTQLAAGKSQLAARDKQISALQSQVNQAVQQSATDREKRPGKLVALNPAGGAGLAANPGSDLAANATPDMRRTASYWSSMDAEAAAKLVQRQPVGYAARIFALMPADSVGQILNNLSPAYAAGLTQDHPELRH